jgi:hypothetical protein
MDKIIKNPNSVAFQETYVRLGKVAGKSQLRIDCQRLQIRVTLSALQVIEKGYSHKMRCSYTNSENTYLGVAHVWEGAKQIKKNVTTAAAVDVVVVVVKSKEEIAAEAELKRLEDKQKRAEVRKTKKWETMKKKIAKLDSWEDIVI